MSQLVEAWYRRFGTAVIDIRSALHVAMYDDQRLLEALAEVRPTCPSGPQPRELRRWLSERENHPLPHPDGSEYVFLKEASGWRLAPAPMLERAAG